MHGISSCIMALKKNKRLALTSELIREVQVFGEHFLTIDEIAYNLGVKPKYFQRFCEKHREVVEVISSARSKTKAFVVGKLMEKVNAGNVPAMIFVLKTQFGFHESVNVGLTESTRDKLIPKKLGTDPIEATRIYQEVMK